MELYIFYFLATIALASAIGFLTAKSPMYAILSLIITMFSIAGLYVLLNAQFLGIVQIIVYAGAIMVLFLYILMMLNLNKEDVTQKNTWMKIAGILSSGMLLIGMLGAYGGFVYEKTYNLAEATKVGLTKNLGMILFKEYVLPFELASILILAGIVGAVLIGKRDL